MFALETCGKPRGNLHEALVKKEKEHEGGREEER